MADRDPDGSPMRRLSVSMAMIAVLVAIASAACEPSAPPGFSATPTAPVVGPGASASAPQGSPAPVASGPTVTVDGTTVRIAGRGDGISAEFALPAGRAAMVVSPCASNQVIPFVTLYDADDNKLGIIVEPEYEITNLVGGTYYVGVVTNPGCDWQIEIKPA
jgi:hypothetical protein